jgi:hypothetical protein
MEKPKEKTKICFDYFEIKDYIIEKYNCIKDEDKTWDWMCAHLEIRNGSYSYIPTKLDNEFTKAVKEEFGAELEVWISW